MLPELITPAEGAVILNARLEMLPTKMQSVVAVAVLMELRVEVFILIVFCCTEQLTGASNTIPPTVSAELFNVLLLKIDCKILD